jgi:hypothetical protein
MNTISKARGTLANILGVVLFAFVLAFLAGLAWYLAFLHMLAITIVGIRERRPGEFRYVTLRKLQVPTGFFVVVMLALLVSFLYAARFLGGWWLAGPMAALAVFIIQADLRLPVIRTA